MLSGMQEILKVGSNENVLGASPKALDAITAALADANLYPDQQEDLLLGILAARIGNGLSRDHILSGNGSCDVLRMIVQTFSGKGKVSVIGAPTFSMYSMLTDLFHGTSRLVPLINYSMDLPSIARAITPDTSLVFICNPNNPTGTYVSHAQVEDFLQQIPPGVLPIFDEAYMEFADAPDFPRLGEFIARGRQLLVTRTFSKLYGLASLRVGYCFGPASLIARIRLQRVHFNSGRMAFLGAAAAVEDEQHIQATLDMVREGRQQYLLGLQKLGIPCLASQANFIYIPKLPLSPADVAEKAIRRGIILRPTDSFGLPDGIRITIARRHENEHVLATLEEIIGK